ASTIEGQRRALPDPRPSRCVVHAEQAVGCGICRLGVSVGLSRGGSFGNGGCGRGNFGDRGSGGRRLRNCGSCRGNDRNRGGCGRGFNNCGGCCGNDGNRG